jgi:EmrB/QacA subfamily drug resistance transporter
VLLDALVLFVAFPSIQERFSGTSAAGLSWVLNAYTIVYGALLVPAGRFADLIGRRRMFLLGVTTFTLASVACAFAPTLPWLIAMRVVQAVGGAMLTPSSLALALAAFPPAKRPIAVTLWAAVGAVAVLVGPPAGSMIVQVAGWRGIFFLNIPIGLVAWIMGRANLVESRDDARGAIPDLLGTSLLIASVALLAFGVVESEGAGWLNARTGGAVAVGTVLLLAFLQRSRRSAAPALDLELFRDVNFARANLGLFVFSIAFSALFLNAVYFLTRVWHFTLVEAGLAMMPGPLMVVALAPIAGRIASKRGHRVLLVPGGLLYAAGSLLLILRATLTPEYAALYLPATMLSGVGVALVLPMLSSAAVQHLPPAELAVGSGVATAIRQFGTVLGVALVLAILGRTPEAIGPFKNVWLLMSVCGALVSVIALGIDATPRGNAAHGDLRRAEA